MTQTTRDRLLDVARLQFAERGFDGVSIASIADDLGLSKQALLHHFSSKEKLYGELLAGISRDFEARVESHGAPSGDTDALVALFLDLAADSRLHQDQTALLMRELLDNGVRARKAGHWYLKGFLESLSAHVRSLPQWQTADEEHALACVYQILGAINYFAISRETLLAMFGSRPYATMEKAFDSQLAGLIDNVLRTGPAGREYR